jgi:hypothetical protein
MLIGPFLAGEHLPAGAFAREDNIAKTGGLSTGNAA